MFIALAITIVVGVGSEWLPEEKLEKLVLKDLKDELSTLRKEIKELSTRVDEIKKLLEE